MVRILILLFLVSIPFFSLTQEEQEDTTSFLRDPKILPLPIFFRLPETGFAGGLAATSAFNFGKDSIGAKPSQITTGFAYTQMRQILTYLNFNIFWDNNKYYTTGEIGWYRYNYKYFGIGENAVPEENFAVDYPRIRVLFARQLKKNHYLGLRYEFEHYNVTDTDEGGALATGVIPGSDLSITSSLGIHYLYDSRDQVFYPRKGAFINAYALPTLEALGATQNFNTVRLDAVHYFGFKERWVWANHLFGNFIQGSNIPFSQLSLLGGPKVFRGIFEGRFRDKNMAVLQSELRLEIWRFIGATAFGSLAFLGDENDFLRINQPKTAIGGGLRFTLLKKQHLNLRVDYGYSPGIGGNFYITFGEAF